MSASKTVSHAAVQTGWAGGLRVTLLILAVACALSARPTTAVAAGGAAPSAPGGSSAADQAELQTIMIEAKSNPREFRRQVDHFVTSVLVHHWNTTLVRWNTPICLLVTGLTRKQDEFILTRVVQAATAARARLAGRRCTPDLFVIASYHPDRFLRNLWAHSPAMYSTLQGLGGVKRYLHSRRAVRVWYNTRELCRGGTFDSSQPALIGTSLQQFMESSGGVNFCSGMRSRVNHEGLQSISSAIVVANMNRMAGISIGQLADYIAMIGLADVRQGAAADAPPTILRLFQDSQHAPPGMSAWDRALLYSIYNTSQSSTMQVSAMETTVVNRLTGP
jgi:hypothetical protein